MAFLNQIIVQGQNKSPICCAYVLCTQSLTGTLPSHIYSWSKSIYFCPPPPLWNCRLSKFVWPSTRGRKTLMRRFCERNNAPRDVKKGMGKDSQLSFRAGKWAHIFQHKYIVKRDLPNWHNMFFFSSHRTRQVSRDLSNQKVVARRPSVSWNLGPFYIRFTRFATFQMKSFNSI